MTIDATDGIVAQNDYNANDLIIPQHIRMSDGRVVFLWGIKDDVFNVTLSDHVPSHLTGSLTLGGGGVEGREKHTFTIGDRAFYGSNVDKIIFTSVSNFGYQAFAHCDNLKEIDMSYIFSCGFGGREQDISDYEIKWNAEQFKNCQQLAKIVLGYRIIQPLWFCEGHRGGFWGKNWSTDTFLDISNSGNIVVSGKIWKQGLVTYKDVVLHFLTQWGLDTIDNGWKVNGE